MILVLRATLFFGLIWALTSFGFTAGTLLTLMGHPSYIDAAQLQAVAAISAVSAVVAIGLAALLAMRLVGKGDLAGRFPVRALIAIGLSFCAMAGYAFLIFPADEQRDFYTRFVSGARFEFLMIGAVALIMSARRA